MPIHVKFEEVAARFPDRDAVVSLHQDRRLTYSQLRTEVDRLAKGLLALGIGRGERVGIWAVDNVEWILVQLATAKIGAVLVNVNPANKFRDLEHVLSAAGLRTLIYMPAFRKSHYAEMVDRLDRGRFPLLKETILFDPDGGPGPAWEDLFTHGASDEELQARADSLESDDPINIQFTSGTTGFPKPVVLTHHNILNNGFSCANRLRFTEKDRLCVPLPFYHCFGMVVSNLGCFTHGACVVIPGPHFDAEAVLTAVAQEKCTALHGVPTMFVAELELPNFADFDLSSLRTGIMAGAPCPPELMRRVIDVMGITEIRIGYGQTEASPVTHMTRMDDSFERRVHTVGSTMPKQEARIAAPDTGATLPLGQQGEICIRGYNVMRGYFNLPKETDAAIDEAGWLHTGDLGVMDEDGYVRITGRLKDMIIRGGENVYPAEIEACLDEHDAVAQAAVFGIPDERLGEEIATWIQLHEGSELSEEEVTAFCKERLAHYKVPRIIRFVTEFPLTVTGKIQKFRMRELTVSKV
ncbi:MAG: AMP-binding protein [Planctomycetota bacterium]|jgi:fatty-acyl-CoA synthase